MPAEKQEFKQVIGTDDDVYMIRYHLTPWRWWPFQTRLMLHVFYRPDAEDILHDHPFDFRTFILWGGYDEVVQVQPPRGLDDGLRERRHGLLATYKADADFRHRIIRLHSAPTVTLVFRSPKRRDWGFYPKGEFVRWTTFLGLPPDLPSAYS